MSHKENIKKFQQKRPLNEESWFFIGLGLFFVPITVIYYLLSDFEPVGTWAIGLLVGLCGLTGLYFRKVGGSVDPRPEEDPLAEVHEHAGEYGEFAPWSWWPLLCAIAVAVIFLGPAIQQWWLAGIGVVIGAVGTIGHILEFNRNHHAH